MLESPEKSHVPRIEIYLNNYVTQNTWQSNKEVALVF